MSRSSLSKYFQNKAILITGAGAGLGYALTVATLQQGAYVMATDVDDEKLSRLRQDISTDPGQLMTEILDVREKTNFKRCIELVLQNYGKLDILINNAGVCSAGEIANLEDPHWEQVLEINLLGTINGCRTAASVMKKQGFGHIVNVASIAGLVPFPVTAPYNISKAGIVALSRTLRMESGGQEIGVTLVCPGQLGTKMFDDLPTVSLSRSVLADNNPFKPVNVDIAAIRILYAIKSKKFLLVFPFYARLMWWTSRIFPGMLDVVFRRKMAKFQKEI